MLTKRLTQSPKPMASKCLLDDAIQREVRNWSSRLLSCPAGPASNLSKRNWRTATSKQKLSPTSCPSPAKKNRQRQLRVHTDYSLTGDRAEGLRDGSTARLHHEDHDANCGMSVLLRQQLCVSAGDIEAVGELSGLSGGAPPICGYRRGIQASGRLSVSKWSGAKAEPTLVL